LTGPCVSEDARGPEGRWNTGLWDTIRMAVQLFMKGQLTAHAVSGSAADCLVTGSQSQSLWLASKCAQRMRVQSLTPTKLPASVWRSRRHTKSHQRVHESARTTQDDSPAAAPRWRRSQPLARRQCNLRSMPAHSWNTWEGRGPASIQSYRKSRENLWI